MTTFQDPPHQSRRALRESEREIREAADAAQEQNETPANESLVPPVATPAVPFESTSDHSAARPASAHSVSSVVEPEPQDGAPVVRSSGRRASRAAAQPSLIEVENSDGSAAEAGSQGEPLDYNTRGRRQVPSYDGPGPSFAQRLREAEAASARQPEEPTANATGEQPQYRVRDFSPEGRRSAAYPPQRPAAAPSAEQAPADLDYRTQQSASADAAGLTSFPPAATELPSLWSPQVAPATPFPLVEPVAPPSAFQESPTGAAPAASAAAPESAVAPESAAYPQSAAAPESAAYPQSAAAPESAAYPQYPAEAESTFAPESAAYPQSAAAPESAAYPQSAAALEAPAYPQSAAAPEAPVYPEYSANAESAAFPASAAAPASVAEAPEDSTSVADAPIEAGPAEPAPTEIATVETAPAEPVAESAQPAFEAEAPAVPFASDAAASVSRPDSVADASAAPRGLTRRELRELRAREEAAAAALVEPELEPATPDAVSNAIAEFEALSRAAQASAAEPVAPVDETPATSDEPAAAPSTASLFSTNQPFSNWLPAEPVTPAAQANDAVDDPASAHSAPVPLDELIADAEQVPDTSVPRPFQWGPVSDEGAPEADAPAPDAAPAEDAAPKPTRDPHAASFEDLFAPVAEQPHADQPLAEQPVAEATAEPETSGQNAADLFSEALASAAPPAYTPPVYTPSAVEPSAWEAPAAEPVEQAVADLSVEQPTSEAPSTEFPRFDFASFPPPSFDVPEAAPVAEATPAPAPDAEPVLLLPAPPEAPEASTNNTGTSAPASPFGTPTPAATPQDFLTPEFVEPPTTTNSTYIAPAGHWSRQAVMDDETQPFENTLSREVGGGNVATTTSALILPTIPQQDFGTALTGAGEVLVTGTIDLPESFGTMGGDSRRYDNPDVDHVFDAFDNEVVSTDSAPVRATRAVSTHTNTHGVIQAAKPNGDGRLRILLIAASVLAVGVVALLVVAILNQ